MLWGLYTLCDSADEVPHLVGLCIEHTRILLRLQACLKDQESLFTRISTAIVHSSLLRLPTKKHAYYPSDQQSPNAPQSTTTLKQEAV